MSIPRQSQNLLLTIRKATGQLNAPCILVHSLGLRYNKENMSGNYSTIDWQETMNNVTIDCSLDIAVHPADSTIVLLTVPGVDGSVDGYQDKYIRLAEKIQQQHGVAVVRIANPFITSHHWESNVRHALSYLADNAEEITGSDDIEIRIMAHSAGAAIVGRIAWEYPDISSMLLINPATKLGLEKMKYGIKEFGGGKVTVLYGENDPSVGDANEFPTNDESSRMRTYILDGVDHNFSGDALELFIQAPGKYLFN